MTLSVEMKMTQIKMNEHYIQNVDTKNAILAKFGF